MSAKKSAPGATGAPSDQQSSKSTTTVPGGTVIAYARAFVARGEFGRYWILVVDDCPHCHGRHVHGGGEHLRPWHGYRAAGCAGRDYTRGYWLDTSTEVAA